ncbi:MAG: AAA family ATPase [Patescibacteria group bacterium]
MQEIIDNAREAIKNFSALIATGKGNIGKRRVQKLMAELNKFLEAMEDKLSESDKITTEREQIISQLFEDLAKANDALGVANGKVEEKIGIIEKLYKEILHLRALIEPPLGYGYFVRLSPEVVRGVEPIFGEPEPVKVDIYDPQGRLITVNLDFSINVSILRVGQRLRISPQGNVIAALNEFSNLGVTAIVVDVLGELVLVNSAMDEQRLLQVAANVDATQIKSGSKVLYDPVMNMIVAILPKEEKSSLQMEEVKAITYGSIGGLQDQIKEFEENIIFPRVYSAIFQKYQTKLPKGAAFYGPPGCGKTLLARIAAYRIKQGGQKVVIFIGSGPEFLVKWVGDSEQKVREPAEYAKAHPDTVVLYMVDEIDAVCRTRGSSGHAGVNDSIVTQFNTLLDGFVEIPNLIFVGITNRLDLLDSSLLRPGRMDLQLKIPRPNRVGAKEILKIYLQPTLPFHAKYSNVSEYPNLGSSEAIVDYLVEKTLDHIYGETGPDDEKRRKIATIEFLETEMRQTLYMGDLVSGAVLESVANRAKLTAALAEKNGEAGGVRLKYLHDAVDKVFRAVRDQISKSGPEEWARMADLPLDKPFRVITEEDDAIPNGGFNSMA